MSNRITIISAPKLHPTVPPIEMVHTQFIITPKKDPVLDTPDKVRAFLEEFDRINRFSPEIK